MNRSKNNLELSNIFSTCSQEFYANLSKDKQKVFRSILNCRTSKLGANIRHCKTCNHKEQSYNSCRNRHCPKCQGSISANWCEQRNKELLPVEYFHSVFTIPSELRGICYQNKKQFYELFFCAVSETLHGVAANPKFLGAKIGFITILHTWNQTLQYHPHIHVISPKGGLTELGTWKSSKANFFLPTRALSKVYRGKLLDYLRQAYKQKQLQFFGKQSHLEDNQEFEKLLAKSRKSDWVVYSKPSFGGAAQVVKYLSSYVHRIAISNKRIKKLENSNVSFSYRDSKHQNKQKLKTLSTEVFTKRFLLHLLPKNFTRIRHYGFLGTAMKRKSLALVREQLKHLPIKQDTIIRPNKQSCSKCGSIDLDIFKLRMIPHRIPLNSHRKHPFLSNAPPA